MYILNISLPLPTQALLENMAIEALSPGDWKQMAKAGLSGGGYLLWKSEFAGQCQATAEINPAKHIPITFDTLGGEGIYRETDQQLSFDVTEYAQVSATAEEFAISFCLLEGRSRACQK